MEDKQIQKAMRAFYSNPIGWTTDEIYSEYVNMCAIDDVEPRPKSVVVREICKEYNCELEERIIKTFRRANFRKDLD